MGGLGSQPMQQANSRQPVREQVYSRLIGTSISMSQKIMRTPKFDGRSLFLLWSNRFQAFLTPRGLIVALEPRGDPIRMIEGLGRMAARDRLSLAMGRIN